MAGIKQTVCTCSFGASAKSDAKYHQNPRRRGGAIFNSECDHNFNRTMLGYISHVPFERLVFYEIYMPTK